MELSRTTKSGYKEHNNKYFEKAVYDKTFRNKFLNIEVMENEEKLEDFKIKISNLDKKVYELIEFSKNQYMGV